LPTLRPISKDYAESLGFDRHIILGWGYSQAILASGWCRDMQSDDWRIFLTCAETLDDLLTQTGYKL